jgi:hypothetical protein
MMAVLHMIMDHTLEAMSMVTTTAALHTVMDIMAAMEIAVVLQKDQWEIAGAYTAAMSHATITSGTAVMYQSIAIRDAAVMFHSIIKSNAAAMFHNIIAKHAAAIAHNTTILAHATMCQSIIVSVAAAIFQNITTSTLANQHAKLASLANHVAHKAKLANANCVSYCQMGRNSTYLTLLPSSFLIFSYPFK